MFILKIAKESKMEVPEIISLEMKSDDVRDLSGIVVQLKVTAGTKNPYYILFPKTDKNGLAKLLKEDFIGQFTDHYEQGLMDYNGSPEDASSIVEVSLFDSTWLVANKKLALAWPLLKYEKTKWKTRIEQYDYMISCKNREFSAGTINADLNKSSLIKLQVRRN